MRRKKESIYAGVIMRPAWLDILRPYPREVAGTLLFAAYDVRRGEKPEPIPPGSEMLFELIKQQLAEDQRKYEERCEQASAAGTKSSEVKKARKAAAAQAEVEAEAEAPAPAPEPEAEKLASKKTKEKKQTPAPKPAKVPDPEVQEVVDAWNTYLAPVVGKTAVCGADTSKEKQIKALIQKYGLEKITGAFQRLAEGDSWLTKKRFFNFDWTWKIPEHMEGIVQGNYNEYSVPAKAAPAAPAGTRRLAKVQM